MTTREAMLVLEDGSVFRGRAFGAVDAGASSGEVVFCTAMTGYQEAITDPSYAGQILVMTSPHIGNYGVCDEDGESGRVQVAGFVIREQSRIPSNQRSEQTLDAYLAGAGVIGLEGVDTRALVRRLRITGSMRGMISVASADGTASSPADMLREVKAIAPMAGQDLASVVSPDAAGTWSEGRGRWGEGVNSAHPPLRVVALDCGAKRNIYRHLVDAGCQVEFLPNDSGADEIRARRPDGLFVSNGPGDPAAVERTIDTLREIAGEIPTFGICLGHQLLAIALGAKTYKLKFGHRGANQPVRNEITGRVEITSQNHGFCVDPESLRALGCVITHMNLNDQTVAGFRHPDRPIFSVQHHPEASPGPHDSSYLFRCFVEMMRAKGPLTEEMMVAAQGVAIA